MSDSEQYYAHCAGQEQKFESRCIRCGLCCGVDDDPCSELRRSSGNSFYCAVYPDRLGEHRTVSGKTFTCVPIREIIKSGSLRNGCGYRNYRNRQ